MIIYKIHQIKDIENTMYAFRGYDPKKFNFSDYECKYEGEFESPDKKTNLEICEIIFHVFNMRRPADFTGHSLSISDVVEIRTRGRSYFYYCDTFGFVRVAQTIS